MYVILTSQLSWASELTVDIIANIIRSIIIGLYPVRPNSLVSEGDLLARLETSLDQWMIDLPDHLRCDIESVPPPPPHLIFLYVQYWSAVILLHRA